jgi:hypothetical protein
MSQDDPEERETPSLEAPSLFRRGARRDKPPRTPRAKKVSTPGKSRLDAAIEPEPVTSRPVPPVEAPPRAPLVTELVPELVPEPVPEPAPEAPAEPSEPWVTGRPAAALAGLLTGGLIVAATAASQRLCAAVRGTSTCGGSGFFLLVVILIVAVLVGGAFLRTARVPDPVSTAFLAVGLLSVVTLLFLVGSLFQWWMAIVIPLVSLGTFLLSYWVTTTYVDVD